MNRSWNATLKAYADQRRQGVAAEAWRLLPADCPRHLVDSLRVCLSANRDDRPATAGQFARQLQLCLQPRVQSLLKPRTQSWQAWARQHPFAAICATGLIPNGICSALNIIYNFREIVSHLKAIDALPVFYRQVAIINPVAFILGTILVIRFAWPVIAALTQSQPRTLAESYELQKRTLKLGDRVAWVSGVEWIVSGFIFPLWLHAEVGEAAGLTLNHYVHFLVSQIICGLLAATQSFFLLTTLSVHVLFAGLVRADQDSPEPLAWLRALLARVGWMYHLAMSLPFLAISAFVLADVRESAPFLVMAALGFGSFAISYRLFGVIQSDIETLAVAVSPVQETSVSAISGATSSRSFRRGS
ncbi:MAG: hypothetical protein JNM18_05530 [Planctomycetaceae bacterium]|nr:hypothetical protein [Planctomycetaceae bacterium]